MADDLVVKIRTPRLRVWIVFALIPIIRLCAANPNTRKHLAAVLSGFIARGVRVERQKR